MPIDPIHTGQDLAQVSYHVFLMIVICVMFAIIIIGAKYFLKAHEKLVSESREDMRAAKAEREAINSHNQSEFEKREENLMQIVEKLTGVIANNTVALNGQAESNKEVQKTIVQISHQLEECRKIKCPAMSE